jgi:hypothetical protein
MRHVSMVPQAATGLEAPVRSQFIEVVAPTEEGTDGER